MKYTKPRINETFTISAAPEWPSIVFETDEKGSHVWVWTLEWGNFKKTGRETTTGNIWDAKSVVTDCGGKLTVRAEANKASVSITVKIVGTNPTQISVTQYLAAKPNSSGFDKIIEHEAKFKHFNGQNEPIKSFDNGYGMCQLTTPTPSFEQIWNWKNNVDGGLALFSNKRSAAVTYLGQSSRTYTNEQLKYETVCRWNGGSYHKWDTTTNAWVRPSSILCDSKTGNIGWDMDDEENNCKTEADLRNRDSGAYSSPPGSDAHWKYSGICYADKILG